MIKKYVTILLITLGFAVPVNVLAKVMTHPRGTNVPCSYCHDTPEPIYNKDGYNSVCTACHKSGNSGASKPFEIGDAANPYGTNTNFRTGIINQNSHNWTGSDVNPAAGAAAPLNPKLLNFPGFIGSVVCQRCHTVMGMYSSAINSKPYLRLRNDKDEMCRDCHAVRDTTSHLSGSHPININYTSSTSQVKLKPSKYYPTPLNANPTNPTSAMKLINGVILCTTCHGVHYTDSNSGTIDSSATHSTLSSSKGFLLRTDARGKTADAINICTNCHAEKGAHNAKNQNIQCNDCHSAHVEYDPIAYWPAEKIKNKFLVRRFMNISTQFGAVRNERTFFRYTGATSKEFYIVAAGQKGVCQSCHYETVSFAKRHYIGGLAANGLKNNYSTSCTTCHNHNNNFSASGAPIDSFPPIIVPTITGILINGWYSGNVTVVLTAMDDDSGVKSVSYAIGADPQTVIPGAAATFDLISDGLHNIAYGATDNADNPATGSITIPIDSTPPTFTGIVLPIPNTNGWYNKDITVHFDATDALSGLASITPDTVVSTEGAEQTVTGTAIDVAGNSSSYTLAGINVDKAGPTITITFPGEPLATTPLPTYQLGFPDPSFTANDMLSGVEGSNAVKTGTPDAFGGGTFTYSVTATDKAGNIATSSVTYEVKATPEGTSALIKTLVDTGAVPGQTADTLLGTLAKALSDYSSKPDVGDNMMNTFQNQVDAALNSHKIDAATASLLLNAAKSIIVNQGQ